MKEIFPILNDTYARVFVEDDDESSLHQQYTPHGPDTGCVFHLTKLTQAILHMHGAWKKQANQSIQLSIN